jgi:hypothetical protein
MPQIVQSGSFNAASVNVPDLYVNVVPPGSGGISNASTNVVGLSGVASWGKVNVATPFGDPTSLLAAFGPITARKFDMATAASVSIQQGANAFYGVRVTDGTDVAASLTLSGTELAKAPVFYANLAAALNTGAGVNRNGSSLVSFWAQSGILSALCSGTVGNSISLLLQVGSRIGTVRAVVSCPALGGRPEVYDNLVLGASEAPTLGTAYALTGGTDGAGVTPAQVAGSNSLVPPTGIFALHGRGCAVAMPVDCDDQTSWEPMAAWAYGEGVVIGVAGPSGETIAQAQISKANAGVDDWSLKVILGDYVYWNDPVNGVTRLVTPQAWWAGRRATLAPNDSSLNKPLVGVAGTAHSGQVTSGSLAQYTLADIQNCVNSGIDLICNPLPGGAYWGFRVGHNSSSDGKRNGENYSFMTMFLAKSINASMGSYVGKPISPTMVNNAFADLSTFGSNLVTLGIIGTLDGSPAFQVTCGASNNPSTLTGKGYLQGAMVVTYQGINEEFVISLDGGATVSVG